MAGCHARYRSGQTSSATRWAPRWVIFGVHTRRCPLLHSRVRPIPALLVPRSTPRTAGPAVLKRPAAVVTAAVSTS